MSERADTVSALRARVRGWHVASCLVAVLALAGCDRFVSTEQRIARAEAAFESGDAAAAMRDVKTALEAAPDDARARLLLARISLYAGDLPSAHKELERAVQAGAEPSSLREVHYALALAEQRYEDVLADAREDAAISDARRHVLIATAQLALGQLDAAHESITQALAAAPDDPDARLAEARWLWRTGKLKESVAALARLGEAHPQFAPAALAQGRFALALGDASVASAAFERASRSGTTLSFPEQLVALSGLFESEMAQGDPAGAQAALQKLQQRAPEAGITRYLKARLAFTRGEYASAVAELQRIVTPGPEQVPARLLLGAALVEQGALEQAGAVLGELLAMHPENAEARKLLARVHLRQKDLASARRVLEEAPETVRDAGLDWLEGSMRLMTGEVESGIARLEQAASADGANVLVKLDLAAAYLLAGRHEAALNLLQALPQGAGGTKREQLTVLAQVAGKTPAEARSAIQRLVASPETDATLLAVSGSYLLATGSPEDARALFERALAADKGNVQARLGLAAVAARIGDRQAAREQLSEVTKTDSANERAWLGLAALAVAEDDRPTARQYLERSISANPAAVESRLRLAELAFADGDTPRAESMISQALEVTRDRPRTLNAIGHMLLRASRPDDALRRFNEAAALGVQDAQVSAAATLTALGRLEEARGRLEAVLRERPDGLTPVSMLVGLDVRERHFDAALARLAAFEKRMPAAAAAVEELRGQVLMAAGRHDQALRSFEHAARERPSGMLAIKQFVAREAAGEPAPQKVLTDWLATHPRDSVVRLALASYYGRKQNRSAAIREYEQVLSHSADIVALNNLAWLYYESRDPRALEYARRAYEQAPHNSAVIDTYGWILTEQGRTKEGLQLLEKAAKTGDPDMRYHHAAALAREDKKALAGEVLRKLLAEARDFSSRQDAEALLSSLDQTT